jgi:hypothetical protein
MMFCLTTGPKATGQLTLDFQKKKEQTLPLFKLIRSGVLL